MKPLEPATQKHQNAIYKKMAPYERLQEACRLYKLAEQIIWHRERRNHPNLTPSEINQLVRKQFQGS